MDKFLEEIFKELSKFKFSKLWRKNFEEFRRIYRRRKIEEIRSSGYFLGCYDPAILLYSEAIKRGIPARFVEMISKKSFVVIGKKKWVIFGKRNKIENIVSHCFVELKLNGKWKIIDPTQREILPKYPPEYTFFSEGPEKWKSFDEFLEAQKKFILKNFREIKGRIFIHEDLFKNP